MSLIEEVREFRSFIEKMAESVDDETAKSHKDVFPLWKGGVEYKKDYRVRYNEVLYKVLQDHVSQLNWTPDTAVSLYVRVDDPTIEWPEWIQPQGSHDAYPLGYKVSHNNHHWISLVDANVWEPSEENPTLWEKQADPEPQPEPEPEPEPEPTYPEWVQPVGSEDAYHLGDIVSHNEKLWKSLIDNNVWEPSESVPTLWEEYVADNIE